VIKRSLVFLLLASQAFGQSAQPIFDRLSKLRDVSISSPQNSQVLTYDLALGKWKNAAGGGGGGSGTVTSFSAGNLSPLFTTSVSNPSTTPALSFSLSTAGAHAFFGNNTGSVGAPAYVQPAFSDLSGTLDLGGAQASGTLAAGREPAHTGDVTNSAGSLTLTLGNIPDLTTQAGSILATNIAAPTTPATGKTKVYVDSTSKNIAAKNDAGTVNHGVQTRTATANNWIRSIADDGSSTISQPAFADISGTATDAQIPDILTITKASNLSTNGAVYTSGSDGTLNVQSTFTFPDSQRATLRSDVSALTEISSTNVNVGTSSEASVGIFATAGLRIHVYGSGHSASGIVGPNDNWYDMASGNIVIGTDGPTKAIKFSTDDAVTEGARFLFGQSVTSGTSVVLDEILVDAKTSTVTGTTSITTAKGFNKFSIYKPTYTDSSTVTITRGATLYIEDAPNVSGSLTLTNPYALWIDNGIARFDGGLKFTEAAPASGKIAQSNGTVYTDSTPTYPTTAGTSGKILISNGTDIVSSTPTFPNASATSRKIIVSDGTNWVASTETWAVPGTNGNILQSDGTNWTSVANPNNASYRTILQSQCSLGPGVGANTFYFTNGNQVRSTGAAVADGVGISSIQIVGADYPTIGGVAPKLRIRAQLFTNDVAPTGNWTFGLYPFTRPATSGGATTIIFTLGTVVSGSNGATFTAPAADLLGSAVSSDFALPSDGPYCIGVVTTATTAVSSWTQMNVQLQMRNQ
jgi:hypothetical protein